MEMTEDELLQSYVKFSLDVLNEPAVNLHGKVICCGHFNAHSILWDGYNDGNGEVIEELMEIKNLACFNDGSGPESGWILL